MTDEFTFEPSSVEIAVGETVVWRTVKFTPHTVTAYEEEIPGGAAYFASGGFTTEQAARDAYGEGKGSIGRNGEYSHTFETPGTYGYFCIPHESSMVGRVVVE